MADGSIVIDARIDRKSAQADLNALKAQVKSTAQQIGAMEKQLGAETGTRNRLADSLQAARQAAAQTEAELEKVNARLDAAQERIHVQVAEEYKSLSAARINEITAARWNA